MQKKRIHPKEKIELHPRNKHRGRYNFESLCACCPELVPFVKRNEYNDQSIDFFNPEAVQALNKALLKYYYGIENWEIPKGYLCPPIPGRADYIHNIADLLKSSLKGSIPRGAKIKGLDIGAGANCIYPIIGTTEYGWTFVGSDIDELAINSAREIVNGNNSLKGKIELRLQENKKNIFSGIIQQNERFDFTICNPPFHSSAAAAQSGTQRKLNNLKQKKVKNPRLNFGGQNNELWCEGGEERFISNMVLQSKQFANSCIWFTTLVSKQSSLNKIYKVLKSVGAINIKTIPMGQGNKMSRIVAWTFLNKSFK